MGKEKQEDPVMTRVRKAVEASGMTQQVLGEKMGYPPLSARQSVSQFLKSGDPQIGMLRRFCKAVKIDLKSII